MFCRYFQWVSIIFVGIIGVGIGIAVAVGFDIDPDSDPDSDTDRDQFGAGCADNVGHTPPNNSRICQTFAASPADLLRDSPALPERDKFLESGNLKNFIAFESGFCFELITDYRLVLCLF